MGMIPKTTTAERKIWKNITMSRIIGIATAFVSGLLIGYVFCKTWATVILAITNTVGFYILSANDIVNPRQKFYMGYKAWLVSHIKPKTYFGNNTSEVVKYLKKEETKTSEKSKKRKSK